MNLSDLQRKDIIGITSGKKLGRIIDAVMNEQGLIEYFIVMDRKFFKFWKANEEHSITMKDIKKIGSDVILVDQ